MVPEYNTPTAKFRHWMYGSNMAILIILALLIAGFLCYLTKRFNYRYDSTSGGIYSLSPYTKKMLQELDKANKNFELINLMGGGADVEQLVKVNDLLNEYAFNSSKVKVIHPETRDDLVNKVLERFSEESKPYEQTLKDFDILSDQLEKFFKAEAPAFGQLAQQSENDEDEKRKLDSIQTAYSKLIPDRLVEIRKEVKKATTESTSPQYSVAVNTVKNKLSYLISHSNLEQLADPTIANQFSKSFASYIKQSSPRYSKMLQAVKEYQKKLEVLKPLKQDEILESMSMLGAPGVLVLSPDSAKVLSTYDLFKERAARNEETSATSFEGEQAISSTLLAMSHPDKIKVVFVGTALPRITSGGLYSIIVDRLNKANFETMEWSPAGNSSAGQEPTSPVPPAKGKGVIWVVLPPEPPSQQQMMMGMPSANPQPVITATQEHLAAGGSAIFLGEASNPLAGLNADGRGNQSFAYAPLLQPYGVKLQSEYSVVQRKIDRRGKSIVSPELVLTHYQNHLITAQLESLQSLFFGGSTDSGVIGAPTLINVDKSLPADVQVTALIEINNSDNWATKQYTGPTNVFNPDSDLQGAMTLAVAITKGPESQQQRLVVFSNRLFITDYALQYEDQIPGNPELFINSLRWVSGYQNMIAVGAKSGVALRIKNISPGLLAFIDWGVIWVGVPLLVLVSGIVVYAFRRSN